MSDVGPIEEYASKRMMAYHSIGIGVQLDMLWHAIDADEDLKLKFAEFYNAIKAVKTEHPKP